MIIIHLQITWNCNALKKTKAMKIKTIDLYIKTWKSPTYGRAFFSCRIVINFQMKGEKKYILPSQLGDSDFAVSEATRHLIKGGTIPEGVYNLSVWCRENGVILRKCVIPSTRKEVEEWGLAGN